MATKKESEEQIKFHLDAILQVGDLDYMRNYLAHLGYKNLRGRQKLLLTESDTLLEQLCRKGKVSMLKFIRENNLVQDVGTYADKLGLNCLHHAVQCNQPKMISYLLENYPELSDKGENKLCETPLFFTLSKHQSAQTKLSLVRLFLEHNERVEASEGKPIDLMKCNRKGKTVYEAYTSAEASQSSGEGQCTGVAFDHAAATLEKEARLQKQRAEGRASHLFLKNRQLLPVELFSNSLLHSLRSIKNSQERASKIESVIFDTFAGHTDSAGDLSFNDELRDQLVKADKIQQKLRDI